MLTPSTPLTPKKNSSTHNNEKNRQEAYELSPSFKLDNKIKKNQTKKITSKSHAFMPKGYSLNSYGKIIEDP